MKTNVVLTSSDRVLFGVQVRQETKTGFLNLSDLQDAYDSIRVVNGWVKKDVNDLLRRRENQERIHSLLVKQGILSCDISQTIESFEKSGVATHLKSLGVYRAAGARHTRTTWANPYIWVMVAMELNPELYAEVVMWLSDRLIMNRIEAGELYKGLTKQLSKWQNPSYAKIAIKINEIVFGKHFAGIRNTATEKELKEISEIEKFAAGLIENDYILNENDLFQFLERKEAQKKQSLILP